MKMLIKFSDRNPSESLKAQFTYNWSDERKNLSTNIMYFLITVATFLGFFYTFTPAYGTTYDKGILITLVIVLNSAFILWFYYRQHSSYWGKFETYESGMKAKGVIILYEINSSGVVIELPQKRSEYKWTGFKHYKDTKEFIVLIGKSDEFVPDIWINKSFIDDGDSELLLANLEKIFDFV